MRELLLFCLLMLFLLGGCQDDPVVVEQEARGSVSNIGRDTLQNDTSAYDTTQSDSTQQDTIQTDSTQTDSLAQDSVQTQKPAEPQFDSTNLPMYFPPAIHEWARVSPQALGWNVENLQLLLSYLEQKNTYGFVILHRGRIVSENYWNSWNRDKSYPIASAGKSITAFLVGLLADEGKVNINERTSAYLGNGWSSLPAEKESKVKVVHHLSMTTGLDEEKDPCTDKSCLTHKADAGTRWAYHNAPYNLLNNLIEKVSGESISDYTKKKLAEPLGLKNWTWENDFLALTTRDMARFGLLILNNGTWNGKALLNNKNYLTAMLSSSSNMNKSYGYLWWLNGKASHLIPTDNEVKNGALVPSAPADMVAAMGKGDQKIYVVPSLDLVVVRQGGDTGEVVFGPSSFDAELWSRLNTIIK